jgi:hypothetical protein
MKIVRRFVGARVHDRVIRIHDYDKAIGRRIEMQMTQYRGKDLNHIGPAPCAQTGLHSIERPTENAFHENGNGCFVRRRLAQNGDVHSRRNRAAKTLKEAQREFMPGLSAASR